MFENPFCVKGNWYRANLHAHTTNSDCNISPEADVDFYRDAGYQVLALTDHWYVSDVSRQYDDMLVIPSVEFDVGKSAQGKSYHIVGINMRSRGRIERPADATVQGMIAMIHNEGGIAFIAHPYWSGLMAQEIGAIEGCFALEVYNTGCDIEILRGFSMVHWDDALTLGYNFGTLATDDGHRCPIDHALGWTMIRAASLTSEAIVEALRKGHYYASTGPLINDISIVEGKIHITTSPVTSIALVSEPGWGGRTFAEPGETITSTEFELPGARYCRVEVSDAAGKTAWSNPILL